MGILTHLREGCHHGFKGYNLLNYLDTSYLGNFICIQIFSHSGVLFLLLETARRQITLADEAKHCPGARQCVSRTVPGGLERVSENQLLKRWLMKEF